MIDPVSDVHEFMTAGRQTLGAKLKAPGFDVCELLRDAAIDLNARVDAFKRVATGATEGDALMALRVRLILEEVAELCSALSTGDAVEAADALADIDYVSIGTALAYGIPHREVWSLIHHANMAKFAECRCLASNPACPDCGGTGYTRYLDASGKVAKPPGWKPADIAGLLAYYDQEKS